jgi:uncharacterized membrane protein YfcA
MEILGYVLSALIGLSLGLTGGGGSILTVPVLVYAFGISPMLSISYSLFIVGVTSLVGAFSNYQKNLVSVKTALTFGTMSIITVVISRKFILPHIPHTLLTIGQTQVNRDVISMLLFSILMLVASVSSLKGKTKVKLAPSLTGHHHVSQLVLNGAVVGIVTGLLGAGGGFLLIPVLMNFLKMPIKVAIGTSLLIIGMNSLVGFVTDLHPHQIDWIFILSITTISILGVIVGSLLSRRISGEKLKQGFGWFVLLMGIYILVREILQLLF